MKMVDMRLPKPKKDNGAKPCPSIDGGEEYPWGLRVTFDKEALDKVDGLFDQDVGDTVKMTIKARVIEKRHVTRKEGDDSKSVELQIVAVGFDSSGVDEKAFDEGSKK